MFVLSNTLRSYLVDPKVQAMGKGSLIPEREMRLTLALAGPSVILTTFTVLAAFFISSVVSTVDEKLPPSVYKCLSGNVSSNVARIGRELSTGLI